VDDLRQQLQERWRRLRPWLSSLWHVLDACRVSLLVVLAGLAALTTSQGADALRALYGSPRTQRLLFLAVVAAYGLDAWYFPRRFTTYKHAFRRSDPDRAAGDDGRPTTFWASHLPRWLGAAGPASVAAAILAAPAPGSARLAGACGAIALLVLAFTYGRRGLGAELARRSPAVQSAPRRLLRATLGERQVPVAAFEGFRALPRAVKVPLVAIACAAFAAIAALTAAPLLLAPLLGPLTLLVAALAVWLALGSYAVYLGLRARTPVVSLVLLWAVVVSPCNDDHRVRVLDAKAVGPRPTTAQLFEQFVARQPAFDEGHPLPVVIVAAEGGGIRAAYWTASILARLQDARPEFARRLFAVSGVSGGSLGATVFASALRHRATLAVPPGCAATAIGCSVRRTLAADHLSPVLGMLLFPDLLQRFLFFPVPALDRSRGLEDSWARSFREATGSDQLRRPFADLAPVVLREGRAAPADSELPLPALFLNATAVESGRRLLLAPVDVAAEPSRYVDALDGLALAGGTLSASAAVHLSARFPYLSPVARLPARGPAALHAADGGYFEGSGATTAIDLLAAFDELARARGVPWMPIVLLLTNDDPRDPPPSRWLTELTGPPQALLATRGAHTVEAMSALRSVVEARYHGRLAALNVPADDLHVPLGWMMSEGSVAALDRSVELAFGQGDLRCVLDLLPGTDRAPASCGRPEAPPPP
jgi:hypothetical protein